MKSNHLQKFESSVSSKIKLYNGTIIETLTGNYLNKIFYNEENMVFDFDCLFDCGNEVRHEGHPHFVDDVTQQLQENSHTFNYLQHIKKVIGKDFYLFMAASFLAPLFGIPFPLLMEDYLNWLLSEECEVSKGIILTFWICLFSFLQIFLILAFWVKFARFSSVSELLCRVLYSVILGFD